MWVSHYKWTHLIEVFNDVFAQQRIILIQAEIRWEWYSLFRKILIVDPFEKLILVFEIVLFFFIRANCFRHIHRLIKEIGKFAREPRMLNLNKLQYSIELWTQTWWVFLFCDDLNESIECSLDFAILLMEVFAVSKYFSKSKFSHILKIRKNSKPSFGHFFFTKSQGKLPEGDHCSHREWE